MPDADADERVVPSENSDPAGSAEPTTTTPLDTTFGTAVGAAMLGFEQAFRSEPPAEVMAAEHAPERGTISRHEGLVIELPEMPEADGQRAHTHVPPGPPEAER